MAALGCLARPAEPALRSVEPAAFDAALETELVFHAEGLLPRATLDFDRPSASVTTAPTVSAYLQDGEVRVEVLDVRWVDATRVTGRLAAPVAFGVYDVHLIEPRGRELVLPGALEALDCGDGDCLLPDGGLPDSGVVTCSTSNYRDRDRDGFGSGNARTLCGPGWAPVAGDCNDRDALTFPGSPEVCNGLDDDCNGTIDLPGCSDGGWTTVEDLRSNANDFVAASAFAPGAFFVISGARVFVRRGELGFFDVSMACPTNLQAVFAEPGGEAVLGGGTPGAGRLAEHTASASACLNTSAIAEPLVAAVGFLDGLGYQYVAVTRDGRVLRWRRGEAAVVSATNLPINVEVTDLHGVSSTQLYAVGSVSTGSGQGNTVRPVIWAMQTDGGWQEEAPRTPSTALGQFQGVWALSALEAIAVGENGLIRRRSAAGWSTVSSGTTSDLTSVRAFAPGRFYVTTDDGRVRRRSGSSWVTVGRTSSNTPLNDLAGTHEADLWAVGRDGAILRSPR